MRKKIIVGLDFDGVVAYNPFRVVRSPWAYFKNHILGIKKLTFFYPRSHWQQIFWKIIHESSIFPAQGMTLLKRLIKDQVVEAHLITARYSFLDDHLSQWLKKNNLNNTFTTININKKDEQPHLFKEKMLKEYNLDFFVEDNLDIVRYLYQKQTTNNQEPTTKIFWIYNILDRFYKYPYKYPYLEKALEEIVNQEL